jgi:hypothetical protein
VEALMSLCPHGFTAFWDCPECECPGCGRTQDACVCHLEPRPEYHGAAGPLPVVERPREDSSDLEDARLSNLPHDA